MPVIRATYLHRRARWDCGVVVVEASNDRDFELAFTSRRARRCCHSVFSGLPRNRDKILELAARHKIPAIYPTVA